MKWIILLLSLLSAIESYWAFPGGAPTQACASLMPDHMGQGGMNDAFFIMSDVIDNNGIYTPGETYEGKMVKGVLCYIN